MPCRAPDPAEQKSYRAVIRRISDAPRVCGVLALTGHPSAHQAIRKPLARAGRHYVAWDNGAAVLDNRTGGTMPALGCGAAAAAR